MATSALLSSIGRSFKSSPTKLDVGCAQDVGVLSRLLKHRGRHIDTNDCAFPSYEGRRDKAIHASAATQVDDGVTRAYLSKAQWVTDATERRSH